jgi:1,5-anhydro-D-fructose reductase (1,5-anhydro-D-mannitol-forming)
MSANQQTIRWGIIGCGDVAEHKGAPPLYRVPGSELVAVMRRDAAKAEDFATRHGARRWYASAAELVADPEINAVYIASPHYLHREHATLAARAGKIVLCEKPMGTSAAEAQAIVTVCQENNVPLTVAYYRRYWPITRVIRRLLAERAIGRIVQVRVQLSDPFVADPARAWLLSQEKAGGGVLANAGSHWIDLIRFLFGEIVQATAQCSRLGNWEIEDTVTGLLQTAEGIPVSLALTLQSPIRINEFDILGTEGRIVAGPFSDGLWTIHRHDRPPKTVQFPHSGPAHSEMITELVPRLLAGQPSPIPGEQAVAVWRIMEAIYRSCAEGKTIPVEKPAQK